MKRGWRIVPYVRKDGTNRRKGRKAAWSVEKGITAVQRVHLNARNVNLVTLATKMAVLAVLNVKLVQSQLPGVQHLVSLAIMEPIVLEEQAIVLFVLLGPSVTVKNVKSVLIALVAMRQGFTGQLNVLSVAEAGLKKQPAPTSATPVGQAGTRPRQARPTV